MKFKDEYKLAMQGDWQRFEALGTACVRGKVTQDEAGKRKQSLPDRTY